MPKSFGYKGGGLCSLASDREPKNEGIGSRSFIITSLPGGELMMLGKKVQQRNQGGVYPTSWMVMHSAHAVIDQ